MRDGMRGSSAADSYTKLLTGAELSDIAYSPDSTLAALPPSDGDARLLVAICHLELIFKACFGVTMDPFRRCVQDLEAIDRLLELPHGHDIAFEMFRELLN